MRFLFQVLRFLWLPLVEIDENVFQGLTALQQLLVNLCGLVEPPPLNHVRSTIKILNMRQNNIQHIPNGYYNGCQELKVLGVSYNIMASFPNLSPVARTITNINMNYNKIVSIDSLHDTYFPSLHSLYLSNNHISAINGSFLKNMPCLQFIQLAYNHLELIPDIRVMIYDHFKKSVFVRVTENHWNCAATMSWIRHGVDHGDHFSFDINKVTLLLFDNFHMRCHSPNRTKGLSFWDISK